MGKPYKHPDLSAADRVLDTAFKYAAERNNRAILLNRDNMDRQGMPQLSENIPEMEAATVKTKEKSRVAAR